MSPKTIGLRRPWLRAALGLMLLAPMPGAAIVGASGDGSLLARASVMVLNSRGGICSGVVVAPDIVLTAAHCAAGASELRVHYVALDGSPALVIPAQVVLHPGFSAGAETTRRRSIDLALLRVPSALPGFASASLASRASRKGEAVQVGGWGVAREGDGRSTGTFRTAALRVIEPYGPGKILLWAEGAQGEAGACQGDSGGPISNASGEVVAVTSWARGTGKRQCGEITQGILVGPQRAWIDATLLRWSRTPTWK